MWEIKDGDTKWKWEKWDAVILPERTGADLAAIWKQPSHQP